MNNLPRPDTKRVYGLTHNTDGSAIVRVPRVVKVSIGMPAGPKIWVAMKEANTWLIWANEKEIVYSGPDKATAKARYEMALTKGETINAAGATVKLGKGAGVEKRNFPVKLPYFTFSRMNAEGTYDPDWDTIEAHGRYPTEIDVVFTDDEGLAAGYQMWAASELKCWGDGLIGARAHSMASTDEEKVLSEQAKRAGERFFPIMTGCYTNGCPYAQPGNKNGKEIAPPCKPHGRLQFQLVSSLRLGGVAQFDTTGRRSVNQLFSCIQTFLQFTGAGDVRRGFLAGIPLKLVLRPFKAGKDKGIAYAVSLEFRADTIGALREKLIEAGSTFRRAMMPESPEPAPASRQIAATPLALEPGNAAAMVAEFYEGEQDDEAPQEKPSESQQVANATDERAKSLEERVKAARQPATQAPDPIPVDATPVDVPTVDEAADWANIDPEAPMEDVTDAEPSDADETVAAREEAAGQPIPVTIEDPKLKPRSSRK